METILELLILQRSGRCIGESGGRQNEKEEKEGDLEKMVIDFDFCFDLSCFLWDWWWKMGGVVGGKG